jgi:putative flavoprotein involved in K+ transport
MRYYDVVIIGGGPSGITCSYYLKQKGIKHVILEKDEMLHTWKRERWDSFYLVTPNWMTNIPEMDDLIPYDNAYMSKQEIVTVLERFLERVSPEFIEHASIDVIDKNSEGVYEIQTNQGVFQTKHVIVAAGMYSNPYIPDASSQLSKQIFQMHSSQYKNPKQLHDGNVVVVGSGWSGIQIALEIRSLTGKDVYLSIGSMQPLPTIYRNVNGVYWLNHLSGYRKGKPVLTYDARDLENENIVRKMNQNLRQCQLEGVHIVGRFLGAEAGKIQFSKDLIPALKASQSYLSSVKDAIESYIEKEKVDVPEGTLDRYTNQVDISKINEMTALDIYGKSIGNVIWSTGFRRDYTFIHLPIFDFRGLPILLEDDVSTSENVYFCSLDLSVDSKLKSAFGVGLYAIDESAERTVNAVINRF